MKQYNLGVIYTNKEVIKRIRKFLQAKGIKWKEVGGIFLYEKREAKERSWHLNVGDMDLKIIGSYPLLDVLPGGWSED